jgi:putative restriction endonuclease
MANNDGSDRALLERFDRISVWSRGEVRAVHKPLLLLIALSRAKSGERWLRFNSTSNLLVKLLQEFGPPSKSLRPDLPYWRLVNDGVWELPEDGTLRASMNKRGAVPLRALRELDAHAGFPDDLYAALAGNSSLVDQAAVRIVERSFPEPIRQNVLRAVGLTSGART